MDRKLIIELIERQDGAIDLITHGDLASYTHEILSVVQAHVNQHNENLPIVEVVE